MQAQEKWLFDVDQGDLRTKWDCETQGEDRWRFPGPSFPHSPLEVEHPGNPHSTKALGRERCRPGASKDGRCSGRRECPTPRVPRALQSWARIPC